MLIRLNFQTLTEALRKLWPHLLNELISVFEAKDSKNYDNVDKEDIEELTIEAIKLVELLSSLNIEDFQINQWIFLIDGYGMQLEKHKTLENNTTSLATTKEIQSSVQQKDLNNSLTIK